METLKLTLNPKAPNTSAIIASAATARGRACDAPSQASADGAWFLAEHTTGGKRPGNTACWADRASPLAVDCGRQDCATPCFGSPTILPPPYVFHRRRGPPLALGQTQGPRPGDSPWAAGHGGGTLLAQVDEGPLERVLG